MKNSAMKWRLCAAATLVAALAACGGSTTVTLGGTVSGLVTTGLVLMNGTDTVAVPANATSYTFPAQIDNHGRFAVTVKAQPQRYTCYVAGGSGLATGLAITSANVYCDVNTFSLGGTITGMKSGGLTLVNGTDRLVIDANATTFVFANPVADGSVYSVAILANPAGQTCSVKNGTNKMDAVKVENVIVSCVDNVN